MSDQNVRIQEGQPRCPLTGEAGLTPFTQIQRATYGCDLVKRKRIEDWRNALEPFARQSILHGIQAFNATFETIERAMSGFKHNTVAEILMHTPKEHRNTNPPGASCVREGATYEGYAHLVEEDPELGVGHFYTDMVRVHSLSRANASTMLNGFFNLAALGTLLLERMWEEEKIRQPSAAALERLVEAKSRIKILLNSAFIDDDTPMSAEAPMLIRQAWAKTPDRFNFDKVVAYKEVARKAALRAPSHLR